MVLFVVEELPNIEQVCRLAERMNHPETVGEMGALSNAE